MTRLRQSDLAAFSDGLSVLYADSVPSTLSTRILSCLRRVFPCEFASFSLLDRRRGQLQMSALAPAVTDWPGMAVHQRYLRHDPAAAHIVRTGDQRALKISDFVTLRQYRDLSVYTEVFRRVGCNRRLGFAIQGNSPVSLVTTLNRSGRDFSEEERHALDTLRPHLLQANEQVLVQQRMEEEHERERANLGELFGAGLGEVDSSGRVLWLTQRAQALIHDFFPIKGHAPTQNSLPEELRARLSIALRRRPKTGGEGPVIPSHLIWRFEGVGGRTLKVRLVHAHAASRWHLMFEGSPASAPAGLLSTALQLTPREGEVLYWVMQGKTNWELGAILGITEKTASRHLENIYAKLHVENRTGAMRVAFEASATL